MNKGRAMVSGPTDLAESLLVRELMHRINNDFASLISAASRASASVGDPHARATINELINTMYAHAEVNRALQMPDGDNKIDVATYVESLCRAISRSKLESRNIRLTLLAPSMRASSSQCWKLGLIVAELITNSMRHGFDTGGGEIKLELWDLGDQLKCSVSDNGGRVPQMGSRRSGLSIIEGLVAAMRGTLDQQFGRAGALTVIRFPAEQFHFGVSPPTPESISVDGCEVAASLI